MPTDMAPKRRAFLLGGGVLLAQAASHLLPRNARAATGPRFSLADFGGIPGASPALLVSAFDKAFARLKEAGGGELLVPPGLYDFGPQAKAGRVVSVDDLSHVLISARGAIFRLNTMAKIIPCMFYFFNPNQVAIVGARFEDVGADPGVDWRGMYCVKAESNRPCAGFRMSDCAVDGAVGMFQSLQHNENRFLMKDIHLQGTVRNAYYGAGLTYVGDNAQVDLRCENVRRGCISFGLRNAEIRIRMHHAADAAASNGFISLACEGEDQGNVENVRIDLQASGTARHGGLVHFYHVKSEAHGTMRNVDVHVAVDQKKGDGAPTSVFVFDHELAGGLIAKVTARGWDGITLRGSVRGDVPGRLIHNPSLSIAPCAIYVERALLAKAGMPKLPSYFHSASA